MRAIYPRASTYLPFYPSACGYEVAYNLTATLAGLVSKTAEPAYGMKFLVEYHTQP